MEGEEEEEGREEVEEVGGEEEEEGDRTGSLGRVVAGVSFWVEWRLGVAVGADEYAVGPLARVAKVRLSAEEVE